MKAEQRIVIVLVSLFFAILLFSTAMSNIDNSYKSKEIVQHLFLSGIAGIIALYQIWVLWEDWPKSTKELEEWKQKEPKRAKITGIMLIIVGIAFTIISIYVSFAPTHEFVADRGRGLKGNLITLVFVTLSSGMLAMIGIFLMGKKVEQNELAESCQKEGEKVHCSQFANELPCQYCGRNHGANEWPLNGDWVPFYFQKEPTNYHIRVQCPHCNKDWHVVWDDNPGPVMPLGSPIK